MLGTDHLGANSLYVGVFAVSIRSIARWRFRILTIAIHRSPHISWSGGHTTYGSTLSQNIPDHSLRAQATYHSSGIWCEDTNGYGPKIFTRSTVALFAAHQMSSVMPRQKDGKIVSCTLLSYNSSRHANSGSLCQRQHVWTEVPGLLPARQSPISKRRFDLV
jgi:hypothetical protein